MEVADSVEKRKCRWLFVDNCESKISIPTRIETEIRAKLVKCYQYARTIVLKNNGDSVEYIDYMYVVIPSPLTDMSLGTSLLEKSFAKGKQILIYKITI